MKYPLRKAVAVAVSFALFVTQILTNPALVQTALAQPAGLGLSSGNIWADRAFRASALKPGMTDGLRSLAFPNFRGQSAAGNGGPHSFIMPLLNSVASYARTDSIDLSPVKGPVVVVLQDVHANLEAQKNIGETLLRITGDGAKSSGAPVLVGVEAAHGPFDFSRFKRYPNAQAIHSIADALLRENRISAVSWMGLVANDPAPAVVGVDDPALYVKNVDVFKKTVAFKMATQRIVDEELGQVQRRKRATLSSSAARLYDSLLAFHSSAKPIAEHIRVLASFTPVANFPTLARLAEAVDLEKKIDQKKAEEERGKIVQRLGAADSKSLQNLVSLSLSFQSGAVDGPAFYTSFCSILKQRGIDTAFYPHFAAYVAYSRLADAIKQDRVFSEIQRMTSAAIDAAAKTPAEKTFFARGQYLQMAKKLVNFELTPDEWAEYGARQKRGDDLSLLPFESFYETAEARNQKMFSNLMAATSKSNARLVVLIAGGFHTYGLTKLLQRANAPYAVLSPKLSAAALGDGVAYLDSFIRDRAPLTKLFFGEKLTVGEAQQLLGAQQPISRRRSLMPMAALSLFTVLLAAFVAQDPQIAFAVKAAAISVASGGIAILLSANRGISKLRVNDTTEIDVTSGASGPVGEAIEGVEGLGRVSWTRKGASLATAAVALTAGLFSIVSFLNERAAGLWNEIQRRASELSAPTAFQNQAGLHFSSVWMIALAVAGAIVSIFMAPMRARRVLRIPPDVLDVSVDKLNAMSSDELWDFVKENGYLPIHQKIPLLPFGGGRVQYRFWNYMLSHSPEELAEDLRKMPDPEGFEGFSAARLLENSYLLKKQYRWPKAQKIIAALSTLDEALNTKKLAEIQSYMNTGNFSRFTNKANPLKVVYVASEQKGLFHTGGIGVVADGYPKTLWGFGHDVTQIVPFYEGIGIEKNIAENTTEKKDVANQVKKKPWKVTELPTVIKVPMGNSIVEARIVEIFRDDGPTIYLIKSPTYFGANTLGKDTMGKPNPYFPRQGMNFIDGEAFAAERYIFFSKASMIAMAELGALGKIQAPEILHLNDWQTGTMAAWNLYVKATSEEKFLLDRQDNPSMRGMSLATFVKLKEFFKKTASVYSVHNAAYQGLFSDDARYQDFDKVKRESWRLFEQTGLPREPFFVPGGRFSMEYYGQFNSTLAAQSADVAHTVSPQHALELQISARADQDPADPDANWVPKELEPLAQEGGYRFLSKMFRRLAREYRFIGVANGVDATINPRTLEGIIQYGLTDVHEKKPLNKTKLLEDPRIAREGTPAETKRPPFVIGVVARMEKEKGFDLIIESIPAVLSRHPNAIFIILGTGKREYQDKLLALQARFPANVRVRIEFDLKLALAIQVGADVVLVPSLYEPSGLTHFEAMAVGTLPIVAPSGGLFIVNDAAQGPNRATGFVMENKTADALTKKIDQAAALYETNDPLFLDMIETAMKSDFTWPNSVDSMFETVYHRAPEVRDALTGVTTAIEPFYSSTAMLESVYRGASAFWSYVLDRPVFQGEKGREQYKTRWYGAALHEALLIILPLLAGSYLVFSSFVFTGDYGSAISAAVSIIFTAFIFLALHYKDAVRHYIGLLLSGSNAYVRGSPGSRLGAYARGFTLALFIIFSSIFTPAPSERSPQFIRTADEGEYPQALASAPFPFQAQRFLLTAGKGNPIAIASRSWTETIKNSRAIGVTLIFIPLALSLSILLAMASFIPADYSDLAQYIKIGAFVVGAITTIPSHAWWNGWSNAALGPQRQILNVSPRDLTIFPFGNVEVYIQKILNGWKVDVHSQEDFLALLQAVTVLAEEGRLEGFSSPASPSEKAAVVIWRRVHQGFPSGKFYDAIVLEGIKRVANGFVNTTAFNFLQTGFPSDFEGVMAGIQLVLDNPSISDSFRKGRPIYAMTDLGFKTRGRLFSLGEWQGTVPLIYGAFGVLQIPNMMALNYLMPKSSRDKGFFSLDGSDNVVVPESLKVGEVPLSEVDDNPETKDWDMLFWGQPTEVLKHDDMEKLDSKEGLTMDEKSGKRRVTSARLEDILGSDRYATLTVYIKENLSSLGALYRDPKNGRLLKFIEKYRTQGLSEDDMILMAYLAGDGFLLKNMYKLTWTKQALLDSLRMANFKISAGHRPLRIIDYFSPRLFQIFGSLITAHTEREYFLSLPNDLKRNQAKGPMSVKHQKLIWHLVQAFAQGGEVHLFEASNKDEVEWDFVRVDNDKKTAYHVSPAGTSIYKSEDGRTFHLFSVSAAGHETEPPAVTPATESPTTVDMGELLNPRNRDHREFVQFKTHAFHVVSIGKKSFWKDAGKYSEYWNLLYDIFFTKEGRSLAGLPGPEVSHVNTYIDPAMVKENRIYVSPQAALINVSIRGEGEVEIQDWAGLAWVDIYVPKGEKLVIGPHYRWIVGNTTRGGNLLSGGKANERGGLIVRYHHPSDRLMESKGGEVLKTIPVQGVNVVIRDKLYISEAGAFNDEAPGNELFGEGEHRYPFDEWREKANYDQMAALHKETEAAILSRASTVVSRVTLEAAAMRIGSVREKDGNGNQISGAAILIGATKSPLNGHHEDWFIRTVEQDALGLKPTRTDLYGDSSSGGFLKRVPADGMNILMAGGIQIKLKPGVGTQGLLDNKKVLFITVTGGGNKSTFALCNEHPDFPGETIVAFEGVDHFVPKDGRWENIGPSVLGNQASFKSQYVEGAAISSPVHPHVSVPKSVEFVASGRDYPSLKDKESIENEDAYLMIDAQDLDPLTSSNGPSLLRKLSAWTALFKDRKDLPRILALPPLTPNSVEGLTLPVKLTLIEQGLKELLGEEIRLQDVITDIIVPDWDNSGISEHALADAQKNNPMPRRTLQVSPAEAQVLLENGIRVLRIKDLDLDNGSVHYKPQTLNKLAAKLGEDYHRMLGWGENGHILISDLQTSLYDPDPHGRPINPLVTSEIRELFRRVIRAGLRVGITTTAPFNKVQQALEIPTPPSGKPFVINSDGAGRITQFINHEDRTAELRIHEFERNRFMTFEVAQLVKDIVIRVVHTAYFNRYQRDSNYQDMINRYYTVPFEFKMPVPRVDQVEGPENLVSRLLIQNVPDRRYFAPGASDLVPNIRAEVIAGLEAALRAQFGSRVQFSVEPIGKSDISITGYPVTEMVPLIIGKNAFIQWLTETGGISREHIVSMADERQPHTIGVTPGVSIISTDPEPTDLSEDATWVGPGQTGAKLVLHLLLDILSKERLKENPQSIHELLVKTLADIASRRSQPADATTGAKKREDDARESHPPATMPGLSTWVARTIFGITNLSVDREIFTWASKVEETLFSLLLIGVPTVIAFFIGDANWAATVGSIMVLVRSILFFKYHSNIYAQVQGEWKKVRASQAERITIGLIPGLLGGVIYFAPVAMALLLGSPLLALGLGIAGFFLIERLHSYYQGFMRTESARQPRIALEAADRRHLNERIIAGLGTAIENGTLIPSDRALAEQLIAQFSPPMAALGLSTTVEPHANDTSLGVFMLAPIPADTDSKDRLMTERLLADQVYTPKYQAAIDTAFAHVARNPRSSAAEKQVLLRNINEVAALAGIKNALGLPLTDDVSPVRLQALILFALAQEADLAGSDVTVAHFESLAAKTSAHARMAPIIVTTQSDVKISPDQYAFYDFDDLKAAEGTPGLTQALADIAKYAGLARADQKKFGGVVLSVSAEEKDEAYAWLAEAMTRVTPDFHLAPNDIRMEIQAVADPTLAATDLETSHEHVRHMYLFPVGPDAIRTHWNLANLSPEEALRFTIQLIQLDGRILSMDEHFRQAERNIEMAMEAA